MKILFLDDDKTRHRAFRARCPVTHELVAVETAREAIEALKAQQFDLVFLDHDLGGMVGQVSSPGTGYEVAYYMAAQGVCPTATIIHSFNPVGAETMQVVLNSMGIHNARIPFGTESFYSVIE